MPIASPSTRRAWIEILYIFIAAAISQVALHPEGVDRNLDGIPSVLEGNISPSTRRAWIEIVREKLERYKVASPSPGGRG